MKSKSAVFKLSVPAIFLLALMLAVLTSAQEDSRAACSTHLSRRELPAPF